MFSANPYLEPTPGTRDYERERFEPIVLLHETPASYEIMLDLPECAAKDVDVRFDAHDVFILCRHAIDHCADDHPEFGAFRKRIHLEHPIDTRATRTVLAKGTLDIRAPKLTS
jgi:HSP20 family molecular chaperone IbpA